MYARVSVLEGGQKVKSETELLVIHHNALWGHMDFEALRNFLSCPRRGVQAHAVT